MANPESSVSKGALKSICLDQPVTDPILQCLQIKPLARKDASDAERYRTVFSDINNYIQSMLGTQLNHLVSSEKLERGSFVRIKTFQTNEVKGKKIMVILDCEVVEELGVHEKIGTPAALEDSIGGKSEDTKSEPASNGISGANFYGQPKSEPQTQSRSLPTRSGPNSSSHGNIYPIEAISPFAHNWTIKARCTYKSEIKKWHKASGEGKLFSCNFLDESDEIRATGFNNECDMLYDVIQEGSVYYVSFPCQVKLANKKFSNLSNDYELTFERATIVEKAEDEDSVPKAKYNFTSLADVQHVEKDSTIDTIAVLKEVGEVSQITSKTTQKPYDKRDLTLVDNTNFSIRLTIWGSLATNFDAREETVIAFKGAKVSDFNGRSLSLLSSGSMTTDPDLDEAYRLKGWYDAQGRNDSFTSHAAVLGSSSTGKRNDFKTIATVRDENLGMSETAEYFTLKATIVYIKLDGNIDYPACRSQNCNKKVVETDPGQWRCEFCNKDWDRPEYRYILNFNVSDWTGSIWLSSFDDTGRKIFGISADEMHELKENDDVRYRAKVEETAICRTWVFRCRAKLDTFQDQQRVRYNVSSADPVNFSAEASRLAEVLKQYNMDADNGLFVQ